MSTVVRKKHVLTPTAHLRAKRAKRLSQIQPSSHSAFTRIPDSSGPLFFAFVFFPDTTSSGCDSIVVSHSIRYKCRFSRQAPLFASPFPENVTRIPGSPPGFNCVHFRRPVTPSNKDTRVVFLFADAEHVLAELSAYRQTQRSSPIAHGPRAAHSKTRNWTISRNSATPQRHSRDAPWASMKNLRVAIILVRWFRIFLKVKFHASVIRSIRDTGMATACIR